VDQEIDALNREKTQLRTPSHKFLAMPLRVPICLA